MRCRVLLVLALASCAARGDGMAAYAPVHRPASGVKGRAQIADFTLPVAMPRRGIVVSRGSFLVPVASWVVVDLDARTIASLRTRTETLPDGEREGIVTGQASRTLAPGSLEAIIRAADAVWDPPASRPDASPMTIDATCDVVLLDGAAVVHDLSLGCPDRALVAAVEAAAPPVR